MNGSREQADMVCQPHASPQELTQEQQLFMRCGENYRCTLESWEQGPHCSSGAKTEKSSPESQYTEYTEERRNAGKAESKHEVKEVMSDGFPPAVSGASV